MSERVRWIREVVRRADLTGVVFGVSGGVDSAVVAALCKIAFPEDHHALVLPCGGDPKDVYDAVRLVDAMELSHDILDLNPVLKTMCKAIPLVSEHARRQLQARLRMATLYYYANALDRIVVGTTNRSEHVTGYFTKFGDGGVDIEPIADMLKRDVQQAARTLGFPRDVVERPPTAGLYAAQTDEDELGMTYDTLDRIIAGELPPTDRFNELRNTTTHKRRLPVPFPELP